MLNTIAHSNFGNQVVGNYDTTLATGNAFVYNIPAGTFSTNNVPGAVSTTAYGIWGNRIAGGYTDIGGGNHAYIYNQSTGVFTSYDAPGGTLITHFEGITGGGRANEFNLVADSVNILGNPEAWAVHINASGTAVWTLLSVPGSEATSANSIYGNDAIGVYVLGGVTRAYYVRAGIYNPIANTGALTTAAPNTSAITASSGDDVANSGAILVQGANSVGITGSDYGVMTNTGSVAATGNGGSAVVMGGSFGSLINSGTLSATGPGGDAIRTGGTAVGTLFLNTGTIDGRITIAAGPDTRFENSGWLGISAAGSGTTHTLSGTFAQTMAGTLALRLAADGTADKLVITGQARLGGTLLALFQPGISTGMNYSVLSASGGLTGTFTTLATQNLPSFFTASLGYSAIDVTLSIKSGLAAMPGLGGNQSIVGAVIDAGFNSGTGLGPMAGLLGVPAAQIPHALSVLSGDGASVGQVAAFSAGSQFGAVLSGRTDTQRTGGVANLKSAVGTDACSESACAAPSTWSAWALGFGGAQWQRADPVTGSAASQQSVGGGAFGGDYRTGPNTMVGLAIGVSDASFSVPDNGVSGRATGAHLGVYGLHDFGTFYIDGAVTYTRLDGTMTRSITGIGTSETARSSSVSHQLAARLEAGRPFDTGLLGITPFIGLQPAELWQPAVSETSTTANGGPGAFALTYQARNTTSLPAFLGAQLDASTEIDGRTLKSWLRLAWSHEFMTARPVTAGFQVLPGSQFTVDGAAAASDTAKIGLGTHYALGEQTSIFAGVQADLSDRSQGFSANVGFRFVW